MTTRAKIEAAGLALIDEQGFEAATVGAIREKAGVSNGSFFHFFRSKEELAAALFLDAIRRYHRAMLAALAHDPGAEAGIAALVRAHFQWVIENQKQARFLFEHARSEWIESVRDNQREENEIYRRGVSRWRDPLVKIGRLREMDPLVFYSQVIGPAQIFCRAWLSGRDASDPSHHVPDLIDCAIRAVVTTAKSKRRT
ncbi:MAG: TetR/AcrR family transcriptional regulator [Hyphomicrobiales bacterium]|nr:TetR/AcrR family transcriptional regulator [Hyphomicrobiales bacterium]